jgi:uncharacterized protein YcbK (DUF882 family)
MNLTENFTLKEMLRSDTANRLKIVEQYTPSQAVIENLRKLAVNILQPLRNHLKKPIRVTSGFRCRRLNSMIGGARKSQHIEGKAADIEVDGMTNQELMKIIIDLKLPFDQLINEFEPDGWIHISFDDKRNRKQILTIN